MANTSSAKKTIRSSKRKRSVNDRLRSEYKKARKEVRDSVIAGDKNQAVKLVPLAMKKIDKAVKKKVIHKNTAARFKSRLMKSVNKIAV